MENSLKPCPICNGTNTQISEEIYWTGMRSEPLSVTLMHWCDKREDEFINAFFQVRTRTRKQAIEFWNGRH